MTHTIDLGAGLVAVSTADATLARLTVSSTLHDTALRFDRLGGHVTSSLCYCGGRIPVDVTIQPGALVLALDHEARELAVDPNRWRLAVARTLVEWHGGPAWCAFDGSVAADRLLLTVIGAITHPLLEPLYQAGRAPVREVPRWATPVLRAATAAEAAGMLAERPNRRLVRTLAASLQRGDAAGEPSFAALALATAARDSITADELANLLDTEPFGTDDSGDAGHAVATVDDVSLIRSLLPLWPRDRRAPLLVDALAHHRLADLVTALTQLQWVRDRVEHPLPIRLADLSALCARHVPVIGTATPAPQAAAAPARRPRRAGAPAGAVALADRRPAAAAPARAVAAQPAAAFDDDPLDDAFDDRRDSGGTGLQWRIPGPLLPIHRYRHQGVVFDVATSSGELAAWGRVLNNCVGSYGEVAAHGAAWLIGMWANGELIGCIEVCPRDRTIVQMEGRANRPLNRVLERIANEALHECGVTRRP